MLIIIKCRHRDIEVLKRMMRESLCKLVVISAGAGPRRDPFVGFNSSGSTLSGLREHDKFGKCLNPRNFKFPTPNLKSAIFSFISTFSPRECLIRKPARGKSICLWYLNESSIAPGEIANVQMHTDDWESLRLWTRHNKWILWCTDKISGWQHYSWAEAV